MRCLSQRFFAVPPLQLQLPLWGCARVGPPAPARAKRGLWQTPARRCVRQVPSQGSQTIKIPASSYEFGSILVDGPLLMIGKVFTDGRMTGEAEGAAPRRSGSPGAAGLPTALIRSQPRRRSLCPRPPDSATPAFDQRRAHQVRRHERPQHEAPDPAHEGEGIQPGHARRRRKGAGLAGAGPARPPPCTACTRPRDSRPPASPPLTPPRRVP